MRKLKGYGVLQVEVTDFCNLKCKMCKPHLEQWHQIHGIPKGFLDVELWKQCAIGLQRDAIIFDHVIFQWLGDPLFHQHLDEIVVIAQQCLAKQVGYFRIDSNMILLDDVRMRRMVESSVGQAPMLFVASLDALSADVYLDVKGRDYQQVVYRNIRRFLQYRKQTQAPINLQVQFVVQQGNAHETQSFLQYWLDCFRCYGGEMWHDEIMFKRLSVDGGGQGQHQADQLYHQTVIARGISNQKIDNVQVNIWEHRPWQRDDSSFAQGSQRSACPGLWLTPVLRHDGELMMCCSDLQGELQLGNIRAQSFKELWHSPKAKQVRKDHLQGRFQGVCADCGGINWYDLPKDAYDDSSPSMF